MIDRNHDLPLKRQAELLGISRGTAYYRNRPVPEGTLALMRRIDELHLEFPFAGPRQLRDLLRQEGVQVGRLHVGTLMRCMGIEAIYRRPNTSRKHPGHRVYPYLLRGLAIERPDQVWSMDITYIPLARGYVYLVAVMDLFSRRVLAHRVSITLETEPCIEALEQAIAAYGAPQIMNTDQGSQFTSHAFIQALTRHGIAISMDGLSSALDRVQTDRATSLAGDVRQMGDPFLLDPFLLLPTQ